MGYDAKKRPINAKTGNFANTTDASTWSTIDIANESILKYENVVGIGIVLGEIDETYTLCGLDIDDCMDENGNIAEEAQEIIDLLDTYTEKSPSGKGIHCLFYATKKGLKCKNNKLSWCKCIEIYDGDRYFTLTGKELNSEGY